MVTNYPHSITAHDRLRENTASPERTSGLGRMMSRLQQIACGIGGHDALLNFEQDRVSLRCVSCGHETPGWELNAVPPTVTARGDVRRQGDMRRQVARPRLVNERRIA